MTRVWGDLVNTLSVGLPLDILKKNKRTRGGYTIITGLRGVCMQLGVFIHI